MQVSPIAPVLQLSTIESPAEIWSTSTTGTVTACPVPSRGPTKPLAAVNPVLVGSSAELALQKVIVLPIK